MNLILVFAPLAIALGWAGFRILPFALDQLSQFSANQ